MNIVKLWDLYADGDNQWDSLTEDEKLMFAMSLEREECAKLCDALAVHPEYASEITKLAAMAIRAKGTT